jgi:hypothetical protein
MTGLLERLTLLVLITLFAAVAAGASRAQDPDANVIEGPNLASAPPLLGWQRESLSSGLPRDAGESHVLRDTRTLSTDPANHFLPGLGRLGIETEKTVRASNPLRRNECPTDDDDCTDNSAMPRTEPGKRNLKSLRKPYIGLSITRPLQ